jgi:hypothetical protein
LELLPPGEVRFAKALCAGILCARSAIEQPQ